LRVDGYLFGVVFHLTKTKNELLKIKKKVEPQRTQRARGLNESGGEERLSPYDSFKGALVDVGHWVEIENYPSDGRDLLHRWKLMLRIGS
jgi:hypothetical protein